MLDDSVRSDEGITDVRKTKVKATQHLIHNSLKSLSGVVETKTHDWKFKEAERCSDGGYVYISCCGGHLVVCPKLDLFW